MIVWLALRRVLATLVVVSLALAPVTATAVPANGLTSTNAIGAQPAAAAATAMDDMPCCPPDGPMMPDCQKGCPLAALCWAKLASAPPVAAVVPVRLAIPSPVVWRMNASFVSVALRPPPEPPRS